ncbi:MAG TPA: CBS domain-containing protein [Gaiella sp.]|jgi:crotonyl-CoA carboxylase/reductase|nr:CBS domain-containing protein [Gaiella sp.]
MNATRTTEHDAGLNGTPVREAMHEGVLSCTTATPLSTVAELMASNDVHCVVVTDERDASVWGVISDLDLVAAAGVRDLDAQSAGGSAATPALAIAPDDTLRRAAQMMTEHAAAHLLVVDEESGAPVGVLSTLDIARLLAERSRG